jgi:hypothetical protein
VITRQHHTSGSRSRFLIGLGCWEKRICFDLVYFVWLQNVTISCVLFNELHLICSLMFCFYFVQVLNVSKCVEVLQLGYMSPKSTYLDHEPKINIFG